MKLYSLVVSSMASNTCDIIFVFGPPMPTQDSYIPKCFLSKDFESISLDDLFKQNPHFGLRDAALRIINEFKKNNHQVVVNGNFKLRATRKSLLHIIKKKVPHCSVLLLKLLPKEGFSQVCWAWHSFCAQQSLSCGPEENILHEWCEFPKTSKIEEPTCEEGFEMKEAIIPLYTRSNFKYEMPGLLVQLEAIQEGPGDMHSRFSLLCHEWSKMNSCGHIVIICDGKNTTRGSMTTTDCVLTFQNCMQRLAEQLDHPVYAVQVTNCKLGSYPIPPHPGTLAFVQSQHLIDLHHENTVYVFKDLDHMKLAQVAGVKHIKISVALRSSKWIVDGPCMIPSVPSMLQTMCVMKESEECPLYKLPLFEEMSENRHVLHTSKRFSLGYEVFVFIKNWSSFERFQEEILSQVTPIDAKSKKTNSTPVKKNVAPPVKRKSHKDVRTAIDSKVPSWMTKKLKREPTLESSSVDSGGDDNEPNLSLRSSTVYLMTEQELCSMAKQVLSEAGRDVKVNSVNDEPG